jgi:cyclopropane fatty-acyl-phospholipid synthase-like methyltransferase
MAKKFDYEKIDYGFYDHIFHKNKGIRSAWHHIKFNFIKKKIKIKDKHLDIGCGSGTFISLLKNRFSVGLDISKKQIDFAKKKYGKNNRKFYCYKKKIILKKNFFDSISIIELIEHLTNKQINDLLNQSFNVLKKGGKVYITTPNYLSFWPILELILNKVSNVSYEHQHINKFNPFKIKKIINEKKFKVNMCNSFVLFSPFIAFFSFKLAINLSKFENLFTKLIPGFLLFIEIEKK